MFQLLQWWNRFLALLLRAVARFVPAMAWLRLVGTSCALTGPPRRKAALADHYVVAGNIFASEVHSTPHVNENRFKNKSERQYVLFRRWGGEKNFFSPPHSFRDRRFSKEFLRDSRVSPSPGVPER